MKTYNFLYTFEPENKGTLPVLDMSLSRNGRELTTTIYKKKINLDIYLNWKAFAPVRWKRGMLRTLTKVLILCVQQKPVSRKNLPI